MYQEVVLLAYGNVQSEAASTTPDVRPVEQTESALQVDAPQMLLRIDELAQRVGLPSRTIRFYNTQGLLPAPLMRGRVAFYTQEHMQVLLIIRELKEQQNLPLDTIKHLLEIRAQQGDLHMNLALKQRLRFTLGEENDQRFSITELAQHCGISVERVQELLTLELLFPAEIEGDQFFSNDDVLLAELYQHLEKLGLPLALATLLRFQLRQLVRSEIAAYEQHLLPLWKESNLSLEQQTEQFEQMLTLTDTLISIMHRRLLYQV